MLKTPQKEQVASMLRSKIAELDLEMQDSSVSSSQERSRHHSGEISQNGLTTGQRENEIFEMEDS